MSIRTLRPEAFIVWCADRGIGRNPQSPKSDHLIFTKGEFCKHWAYPSEAAQVPHFVGTLLSAVRPNDRYWVYPKDGVWSAVRPAESSPESRVWMTTVHALGVPAGLRGAVWFNSTDWNALCAMLFLQVTLGPSVHIDTVVVPENASAILYFEHNRVVSVAFRDQAGLDAVANSMEGAGYPSGAKTPHNT
jgi:hypothetical protein